MAWTALTTRERYTAIGAAVAVGLLGLNYFVVSPFIERSEEISRQRQAAHAQLEENRIAFQKQQRLQRVWADLHAVSGMKSDPADTQGQVMQALANWARESGVTWANLDAGRSTLAAVDAKSEKPEARFQQVVVRATGSGNMAAITNLLWRVESAPALLRVNDVQLAPRKENTDDLQIQLSVSTVSVNPDAEKSGKSPGPGPVASAAGAKEAQP